ncbi:MAG: restriction endonuclease [Gemmatimonas sp.]|nr:restriction endonuclease [Gemmatimonas sp.]
MVAPVDGGAHVEIDVLLEAAVGPRKLRIAIECRDHKRPATKEWINEIVGKYAVLPIDRVIAVSRSGFTKGAIQRAVGGRVTLTSLSEAQEADWPRIMHGWRTTVVELHPQPRRVQLELVNASRPSDVEDLTNAAIADASGRVISSVLADAKALYAAHARRRLGEWLANEPRIWVELDDHPWVVALDFEARDRYLVHRGGELLQIARLTVEVECVVVVQNLAPEFYRYEGAAIVVSHDDSQDGTRTTFSMIIDPAAGQPYSLNVRRFRR